MSDSEVLDVSNAKKRDLQYVVKCRTVARNGQLVVLRLGSVCFSVGVIASEYFYENKYAEVFSSWNNDKKFYADEIPLDL